MSLNHFFQHRFLRPYIRFVGKLFFRFRLLYPVWFFGLNKEARRRQLSSPPLDRVSTRIASDLREKGIAITSLAELFPQKPELLSVLQAETGRLIIQNSGRVETSQIFLTYLWDLIPELTISDPFIQLSLDEYILSIVNSYMQMWSRFYLFTLNVTHPVGRDAVAMTSQLWHRDADDKKICKLFVYIHDVDLESGPFEYIPKTAYGQKYASLYPLPGGLSQVGLADALVEKKIQVETCMGKAGTVVFCDTTGIHKGGYAISKERIMFTASYRSPAAYHVSRFRYGKKVDDPLFRASLAPQVDYALEYNKNPFASWLYSLYTQKKSEKHQRLYERNRN